MFAADPLQPRRNLSRIDLRRIAALKPEQDRLVGAVAKPCQGERAIKLGLKTCNRRLAIALDHAFNELPRCQHRPDRVGTGRSDADFEQVENTKMHEK